MESALSLFFAHNGWKNTTGHQEYEEAFAQMEKLYQQVEALLPQESRPLLDQLANQFMKMDFAFYNNDLELAARAGVQLYRELTEAVALEER